MKTEKYSTQGTRWILSSGVPVVVTKSGIVLPAWPKGEKTERKLTMGQAEEIRKKYAKGDATYSALGREYGVHYTVIGKIIRGKTYKV